MLEVHSVDELTIASGGGVERVRLADVGGPDPRLSDEVNAYLRNEGLGAVRAWLRDHDALVEVVEGRHLLLDPSLEAPRECVLAAVEELGETSLNDTIVFEGWGWYRPVLTDPLSAYGEAWLVHNDVQCGVSEVAWIGETGERVRAFRESLRIRDLDALARRVQGEVASLLDIDLVGAVRIEEGSPADDAEAIYLGLGRVALDVGVGNLLVSELELELVLAHEIAHQAEETLLKPVEPSRVGESFAECAEVLYAHEILGLESYVAITYPALASTFRRLSRGSGVGFVELLLDLRTRPLGFDFDWWLGAEGEWLPIGIPEPPRLLGSRVLVEGGRTLLVIRNPLGRPVSAWFPGTWMFRDVRNSISYTTRFELEPFRVRLARGESLLVPLEGVPGDAFPAALNPVLGVAWRLDEPVR